jgi:hypothetical protein
MKGRNTFSLWFYIRINRLDNNGLVPIYMRITVNGVDKSITIIYTNETRNELMKNYRLIPDEKGNVIVYKKFWQNEEENDNFVPPLLVYADLINSDDSRCQETGVMVYKKFLQNNFFELNHLYQNLPFPQ